jgi:hypothetical protein
MKSILVFTGFFLISVFALIIACTKEPDNKTSPVSEKSKRAKSFLPLEEGTIRGYFGNEYRTFTQHIETVQPVDSFSNCYFYEDCVGTYEDICSGPMKQINLIRCDSGYVVAFFIMGVSPDSLPEEIPVPEEFCRYSEIQFYKFKDWNRDPNDSNCYNYAQDCFYGEKVLITGNKNDVLTGTFEGDLISPAGNTLHLSEGEFKIKIVRKRLPCWLK